MTSNNKPENPLQITLDALTAALIEVGGLEYDLEQANAEIKRLQGYKKTNRKRMKPSIRRKLRHLKLISVNGVPISNKT